METLKTTQSAEWLAVLSRMKAYDFYHLPSYHKLAEKQGEGTAELFVHRDGEYVIAIPLLLRPVSAIQGLEQVGNGLVDGTSVYGYSGPIASHEEIPQSVVTDFQTSLKEKLLSMKAVSLFARLHPLLNQTPLLSGIGVLVNHGTTISIDLSLPEQTQLAQYRKDHKQGIRKLREMGAVCELDTGRVHLNEFIDLYCRNMERVGAKAEYFFPRSYFEDLMSSTDGKVDLFVCTIQGEIASAALFLQCGTIIQYHLSATSDKYLRYAPIKLLLDTVRHWGIEQGAKIFHLGGGVGSSADSLFMFKAGFSPSRHDFFTWRWILSESEYKKLTASKAGIKEEELSHLPLNDYFPAYRAPLPAESFAAQKSAEPHASADADSQKKESDENRPQANGENKIVRILVLGGGGHARVVADAILARSAQYGGMELVGFLDDDPAMKGIHLLGKPVFGSTSEVARIPHDGVVVAIGDNGDRCKLFETLSARGEKLMTVIHPNATIAPDVKVGRGSVIFAGVVVNTGANIGDNVILNTGCTVGHDCTIGLHVHICPGAHLGGTVRVRKGATVGIGSSIIQGRTIGEWSIVGGGSAVIHDVAPRTTVVGVPTLEVKRQPLADDQQINPPPPGRF